jgi:hypothetical protein
LPGPAVELAGQIVVGHHVLDLVHAALGHRGVLDRVLDRRQ